MPNSGVDKPCCFSALTPPESQVCRGASLALPSRLCLTRLAASATNCAFPAATRSIRQSQHILEPNARVIPALSGDRRSSATRPRSCPCITAESSRRLRPAPHRIPSNVFCAQSTAGSNGSISIRKHLAFRPLFKKICVPARSLSPASTPIPRDSSSSAKGTAPSSLKFTEAKSGKTLPLRNHFLPARASCKIHAPVLTPTLVPATRARIAVTAPATSSGARLSLASPRTHVKMN